MAKPGEVYIEYMDLAELLRAPRNPKAHDAGAINGSFDEFGYVEPMVLNEATGRLTVGHGRLETLQARKAANQAPPTRVLVEAGRWMVPVIRGIRFKSDAQAEAYLVASNRLVELGGWEDRALTQTLADLASQDALAGTGFEAEDVDAMLRRLAASDGRGGAGAEEPEGTELAKDAEALREKWGVQAGQLWEIPSKAADGHVHRILCGDATDPKQVALVMDKARVELVVTDPPYCSGGFQEAGKAAGTFGDIASDNLSTRGYISLMTRTLAAARPQTAYVFTDWRMWIPLYDLVEAAGLAVRSMIVWKKPTPGLGALWRTQHELVMYASRQGAKRLKGMPAVGNVLESARTGNEHHFTEKPVDLLYQLVENDGKSERGRCDVLDPFMGSGSTLLAAERDSRAARGIDVEPRWVAVALERLARAGLEPRRPD